jgi:hypothetical protein
MIETRLLSGLQERVQHPDSIAYALKSFKEELHRVLREKPNRMQALEERSENLKRELQNLTATAAQTGPSAFLVSEIGARERELREITTKLGMERPDSAQVGGKNLEEFVVEHLKDVHLVLNADIEKARAEIARHVQGIAMQPITTSDGSAHYVAIGNWNLLGTALEEERAPHLLGGGARMVAGVRFELTTFGL